MKDNTSSPLLRVLVVDDWPDASTSLAALLRLWGHDVRIAHEGAEALDVAAAYRPNVVLLDVSLPGMDGYQLARRLRSQPEFERTFVVSVTGYGREEDVQRSREAGCDRHLLKPVDPNELKHMLASRKEAEQEMVAEADPPPTCPADEEVSNRAEHLLRGHPYLALKNVSCDYREGVLTLHGCLPTYYLKQVAQAVALGIEGVEQVRNEIAVGDGHPVGNARHHEN